MYKKRSSLSELFRNRINAAEQPLLKLHCVPCFQVLVRSTLFCLSPGLCPLWQCWDVALARRGCCWQRPLQFGSWSFQLCSVCSELSELHTPSPPGLCWPFQEPWAALGMPPCHPSSPGIFDKVVFQCFLEFSPDQACFSGMRRSCCGCMECWFWEFLTHRKVPAAQDMHILKWVFMNLKCLFFSLVVLFLDFFPPNKPCNELILWLTHR